MYNYLTQIVQAENNGGSWMQMLVFVMLAAFYGISYIIKAKTAGNEEQKQQEKPQQGGPMGLQQRPRTARPADRDVQIPPKRPVYREKLKRPAIDRFLDQRDRPESKIGPADLITKPLGDLMPEEIQYSEQVPLFELDDIDELRKAILYCEIFGKPLALRKPAE